MNSTSEQFASQPLLPNQRKTYKSRTKLTLMAMNIALSSFYFGYCSVYFSQLDIATVLDILNYDLNGNTAKGILNGCIPVGALIGAFFSSLFIRKLSRRKCLLTLNACAFVVGGLLYIQNFYTLVFFRLLQGFFVGAYSALASLLIKELAPKEISGTLGSYTQLNVFFGLFFGSFLAYLLKKITGDNTGRQFWYYLYGFPQITIGIQSIVLLFVFPYETPKYYLLVGKMQQARELLAVIYKEEFVDQIMEEKMQNLQASTYAITRDEQPESVTEYKAKVTNSVVLFVALFLGAMQQFSGVNAIIVYGGDIAAKATSGELSLLMASLINVEGVLAVFVVSVLLSHFGRKTIMQAGILLEAVSCVMVGVGFYLKNLDEAAAHETRDNSLIIAGLFLFMGVFGLSLGPLFWLYVAEIAQPHVIPYPTTINWLAASIVIILFPILGDNVLDGHPAPLFIFFTAALLAAFLVNIKFMVETKDKTEKHIQQDFERLELCC